MLDTSGIPMSGKDLNNNDLMLILMSSYAVANTKVYLNSIIWIII